MVLRNKLGPVIGVANLAPVPDDLEELGTFNPGADAKKSEPKQSANTNPLTEEAPKEKAKPPKDENPMLESGDEDLPSEGDAEEPSMDDMEYFKNLAAGDGA